MTQVKVSDYDLLKEALVRLAERCDGALTEDGKGFNGGDSKFGKDLAGWVKRGSPLTPGQQTAAIRMLQTYRTQLRNLGIELPSREAYQVQPLAVVGPGTRKPVSYPAAPVAPVVRPAPKPVTNADITLRVNETGEIVVKFPFSDEIRNKVKSLSGVRPDKKTWEWIVPAHLASDLLTMFPGCQAEQEVIDQAEKLGRLIKQARAEDSDFDVPLKTGKLRNFQKAGVEFCELSGGQCIIGDDMGLGKTVTSLAYLELHPELRPAILVVPSSVKFNWSIEADRFMTKNCSTHIISGEKVSDLPASDLYIINYDILQHWTDELIKVDAKVIVCDEAHRCFAYNTEVLTDEGWVKIGDIVNSNKNYYVLSCDLSSGVLKYKQIINRFTLAHPQRMARVIHDDGEFTCTPEHKIFTEEYGYVKAKDLQGGTHLRVLRETVSRKEARKKHADVLQQIVLGDGDEFSPRGTRENIQSAQQAIGNKSVRVVRRKFQLCIKGSKEERRTTILRRILLSKMEDVSTGNKRKNIYKRKIGKGIVVAYRTQIAGEFCAHEEQQPHEESSDKDKDDRVDVGKSVLWKQGREWKGDPTSDRFDEGTRLDINLPRVRRKHGPSQTSCGKNSNSLSDGSSRPATYAWNRGRRQFSSVGKTKRKRRQENQSTRYSGVVRVEIYEHRDRPGHKPCSREDQFVYDIEVKDNHNFFVRSGNTGVLVSNCKNPKSKRSIAVHKIGDRIPHRILLTGTPLDNKTRDLFPLLNFVNPQAWPDFYRFAHKYCGAKRQKIGYDKEKKVDRMAWNFDGASNLGELYEALKRIMIRRMKTQVLKDLPAKQSAKIMIELTPAQMREYERALDEAAQILEEAEDEESGNAKALVMIEVAKQAAVKAKMPAVIDWIGDQIENGTKIVAFGIHREATLGLYGEFKEQAVNIIGGLPAHKRQEAKDKFQNDPACMLFVGNIDAAGEGISLTVSSNLLFFEFPWKPGQYRQARDRIYRIGQELPVTIWNFIARGTIDEDIIKLLERKADIIDKAVDGGQDAELIEEDIVKEILNIIKTRKIKKK